MITRLLEKLDSPRRHLAVLVGLLVTTFVLTGALAWQARHAAAERERVAQESLEEIAGSAMANWARVVEELIGGSLPISKNPAAQSFLGDPAMPLREFAALNDLSRFCQVCADSPRASGFFSFDFATGATSTIGAVDDPDLPSRVAELAATSQMRKGVRLWVGLYATGLTDAPLAVTYVHVHDGQPVRAIGVLVQDAFLGESLRLIFASLDLLPTRAVQGLPNDSLFSTHALLGGVDLLTGHTVAAAIDTAGLSTLPTFISGATLQVRVREGAAEKFFPNTQPNAQLTLLALVVLITFLFAASLLLLRREAELVRLRADFIASASHELRTPLAQIRMFTETLLLGRVRSDVERRRSLEIVDQEARRLSQLVENLLQFSKTDGGRSTRIAPEPTVFAQEVRAAVDSFAPLLRTRKAEIRVELQENVAASIDRSALRQILVNLIDNGLKYGPEAQRLTVGLALFDSAARVWVDDEGPGIPPAERERVFESFYRMRRDVDARITGSGIGLAVVRQLARLHDGSAWVEEAPGGGARIVVQFPGAYLRAEAAGNLAAAS
ncbi:MAG TPA: HAMP domain-containing sensor histidine kinase [Longimicrobiales bacterium]|nr:HAMP domain-containing sensor histidine kinase [Longimicrobiales bacterium]